MRIPLLSLSLWLIPHGSAAVEFNRDVRPILADRCFLCHGPDAKTKGIPLRLDREEEAKAVRNGHAAIVPGDPAASELIRRVTAESKARRMPPAHSGDALTQRQIETLRAWIAEGAAWQKHWSFIPPAQPPLPAVSRPEWVANPIDRFILARLDREGLAPSAEAAKETLLRRVSLDLTGLPPQPAELERFLADRSPGAYEHAVDRLLASPRYGERMAVRWLDAARYADTNGYQFDGERVMWRWRDWVIDSFNRNQPFDRFVVDQIAGDLLPNATLDQKIATGFNRNHRGNTEDGIVPEEYAVEYVVDRIETTSAVFLGLTLGCARCHNHKYDPFTQKEFYQVFAFFNNIPENGRAMKYGNSPPLVAAPTREQQAQLAEIDAAIARERTAIDAHAAAIARWRPDAAVHWRPGSALEKEFVLAGGDGVFDGKREMVDKDTAQFDIDEHFTLAATVRPENVEHGAIVSRMKDSDRGKGFGVYLRDGRVHVHITSSYDADAIRLETEDKLAAGGKHNVAVTYDGTVGASGVRVYIDGKLAPVKVLMDTLYRPFRNAGSKFTEPFRVGAGGGEANRFRGEIRDVLVYSRVLSQSEIAAIADVAPAAYVNRSYYLEKVAPEEVRVAWRRLQEQELRRDRLARTFPTVMVMQENPRPKQAHILQRGAYDKPGEPVERGVPAVLPPMPAGAPANRLGFARWLVDPGNPLLARVTVNRFWQMYFGAGIVKTTEDFGQQGEWPSHPELLDWLATDFIASGWDVKALQKKIVMSAAYRQSSRATPELVQRDPENRLLARGPRFRLPAEVIRDQALASAGLLAEKVGGPSVKPYQPDGLWDELAMQDMHYKRAHGRDLYRRSLYTFWKRTIAPPMMVNFDSANREACVVRESRTNTPLQALNLMNDVTFLEAARNVAARAMREGGQGVPGRVNYTLRLVLGRDASAPEQAVMASSLAYHLDYFADEAKARKFLAQGDSSWDGLPARELAAWTSVASMAMNLDEAVTKE
ncbi:MAG: DUF1553 domain-containing protein [Bryobacteraceae bacterium]